MKNGRMLEPIPFPNLATNDKLKELLEQISQTPPRTSKSVSKGRTLQFILLKGFPGDTNFKNLQSILLASFYDIQTLRPKEIK